MLLNVTISFLSFGTTLLLQLIPVLLLLLESFPHVLSPRAVRSQGDHALEVALADDASEPALLRGLLVLLAIEVREPVLLLVEEVDGLLVVVGVITDPPDLNNPGDVHEPLVCGRPVHHLDFTPP